MIIMSCRVLADLSLRAFKAGVAILIYEEMQRLRGTSRETLLHAQLQ